MSFPRPSTPAHLAGRGGPEEAADRWVFTDGGEPRCGSSTGWWATHETPWRPPLCILSRQSLMVLQEPDIGLVAQMGLGDLSVPWRPTRRNFLPPLL